MPHADRMRSHAQHLRELAILAEYPLTISGLLGDADEFDRVALDIEREEARRTELPCATLASAALAWPWQWWRSALAFYDP